MPNATSAIPGGKGAVPCFRVIYHEPSAPTAGPSTSPATRSRPATASPKPRSPAAPAAPHGPWPASRTGQPSHDTRVAELDALTGRGMFSHFYDPTAAATGCPPTPTTGPPRACSPPASSAPRGCGPAARTSPPRSSGAIADSGVSPTSTAKPSPCPNAPPGAARRDRQGAPRPAHLPPAGPRSPTTSPGRSANASTATRKAVTPCPAPPHAAATSGTTPTSWTTCSSPSTAAAGAAWRWRTELAILTIISAALWRLALLITLIWAAVALAALVAGLLGLPVTRRFITPRFWCVLARHRLQRLC